MEREAIITAMKDSISEVMEKMVFLPLDFSGAGHVEELWNLERDEIIISKLNFNGPFSGFFLFFIPRELALSLTAGFLGLDEDKISQDQINETVKELLNMISGNTFTYFNKQAVFDLDLPELIGANIMESLISHSGQGIFIGINTIDNCLAFQMVLPDS